MDQHLFHLAAPAGSAASGGAQSLGKQPPQLAAALPRKKRRKEGEKVGTQTRCI